MTKDRARSLAAEVIYQVLEEGAFANLCLDKALFACRELSIRDRGFATELIYGTIRQKGALDWCLDQFAKTKTAKMDPWLRTILRLSAYQMLYLDKVPVSAAINEGVELAKHYAPKGAAGFANAVLRALDQGRGKIKYPDKGKNPAGFMAAKYSYPQWIVEGWLKIYGRKNTEKMCAYFNEPSKLWIRANSLKITREELKEELSEQGVETRESIYAPLGLEILNEVNLRTLTAFQKGHFLVQDESSMLVAPVLAPQPGQTVIDVCSAPGGKTTHLAQLMENRGEIIACDIHEHRLELIKENADKLGANIIRTRLQDGCELSKNFGAEFDLVLLDAPCSGLGVLGRRADLRWNKRRGDIVELAALQKELLAQAQSTVKPGGTLIYSTCTTTVEEDEKNVEWILENYEEFRLDKRLPWTDETGENVGSYKLSPLKEGTDGFFIAIFKRGEN